MQSYSDFEEILLAFNAAGVKYLVERMPSQRTLALEPRVTSTFG